MKCTLIHTPGLRGTLVHIRRGLQLKTHEYLRTHWDSSIWRPTGSEAGLYILTLALLHFLQLWPLSPSCVSILFLPFVILFFVIFFPFCLLFLWFARSSGATKGDEGMSTCLPPTLPSQQAASVWRRLRCGRRCGSWFFFCSNHSQRTTRVWFGFLQPGRIFHISDVSASSTPPTILLIKFAPYAFEGRWTDWQACFSLTPLPGASGLIRPQPWWGQAPQSWDSIMFPKIAWLKIMKAYEFFFFFWSSVHVQKEEETGTRLRTCSLDRYYQINFQKNKYADMGIKGHIHLITSSWFSLTAAANRIKSGLFHLELQLRASCSVIHIERLLGRVWPNGEMKGKKWMVDWLLKWMPCCPPLPYLYPNEILPSFRRRANQCPYQLSHQAEWPN